MTTSDHTFVEAPRVTFTAVAVSSLAASAVALSARPLYASARDRFVDIVAAEAVASGYVKANDQRFAAVWFAVFGLALLALSVRRRPLRRIPETHDGALRVLIVVTAVVGLVVFAVSHGDGVTLSLLLGVAPLLLAWSRIARRADRTDVAVVAVLTVAGGAALAVAASALTSGTVAVPNALTTWEAFALALAAAVFAVERLPSRSRAWVALAARTVVPLALLPLGWSAIEVGGTTVAAPSSALLRAAVVGVIAAMMAMIWAARATTVAEVALPWPTVAAITAFVAIPPIRPSAPLLFDDFHAGELLVQLPAVRQGLELYRSFVPTPGAVGLLYGAVNAVIGDGFATFPRAVAVVVAVIAGVTGALVRTLLDPARTLVLVLPMAFAMRSDRLMFVIPSILLLVFRPIWSRASLLPWVWTVLAVVNLLLVPASGMAFLVATAPVVFLRTSTLVRNGESRGGFIGGLVAAVLTVVVLSPVAVPAVVATFAQARTNLLLWGRPLFWPSSEGIGAGTFAWHWLWWAASASAWWVSLPIAIFVAARLGIRHAARMTDPAVALLVTGVGLIAALTPYAVGRVDGGIDLTRTSAVTIALGGLLLPAGFFLAPTSGRDRRWSDACAAVSLVAVVVLAVNTPLGPLTTIRGVAVVAPGVPGAAAGSPELGRLPVLEPGYAQARSRVRSAVDGVLRPEETYLDLTNNQALYAYFRRQVPEVHAGAAYLATEELQTGVVRRMTASPPPMVIVNAGTATLGGGVLEWSSVRNYRITRWLAERGYLPFQGGAVVVLVRPDRVARATAAGLRAVGNDVLDAAVAPLSLESVPRAWGESWSTLRPRFRKVEPPEATRPDFVLVSSDCEGGPGEVRWTRSDGGTSSIAFTAGRRSLVPVGARLSYLMAPGADPALTVVAMGSSETCTPKSMRIEGTYRLVR